MIALVTSLFSTPSIRGEVRAAKRPFTVQDSIGISYIVDPERETTLPTTGEQRLGQPIYSPDGKHFLLVTQRGVLSTNTLEGTIWLFDLQRVREYGQQQSSTVPIPRKLVVLSAISNTPVIRDLRWIDESKRLSFLGKNGSPYQRLFIADVQTGAVRPVTREHSYVTAYDIQDDAIAYTLLQEQSASNFPRPPLVDVGQQGIDDLLYRNTAAIGEIQARLLLERPSLLHLQKKGQEVPIGFSIEGRPLQLYVPFLSLSPDGKSLITVAPVWQVAKEWERYRPMYEEFRLRSGLVGEDSPGTGRRPEQFVSVNLKTGMVSPLVAAPLGRDLGYSHIPTEVFWLRDKSHAILTNTYLPASTGGDTSIAEQRMARPAIAVVDVATRDIHGIVYLRDAPSNTQQYHIRDIRWDPAGRVLTIQYEGEGEVGIPVTAPERYLLNSDAWVPLRTREQWGGQQEGNVQLRVYQDLNHPPALWVKAGDGKVAVRLWDPNPQLEDIKLGATRIYHWQDTQGNAWSGVAVFPPGYDASRRYPLVIQTHGYDAEKFFADGYVTSGSGGRALAAKDVIVLQMDIHLAHISSPEEGPESLAGFESAIDQLAADGLVDRARVGVIGFSRTCFHVLYALTHHPDLFRAASITDGVNFGYLEYAVLNSDLEYRREAEAINQGPPFGQNLTTWIRNAPNFTLDRVQTPLFIWAMEKGSLLSEWETYSALRRLNKPAEMVWWWKEDTPHVLIQPAQRYASQQSAVDWFDFWLDGAEDPDSSKAEQYARWRELRKLQVLK